jgi:hypothetical protein
VRMAADVAPGGLFRAALEQYDASATWTCVDARAGGRSRRPCAQPGRSVALALAGSERNRQRPMRVLLESALLFCAQLGGDNQLAREVS